jgi:PLP dependent protein
VSQIAARMKRIWAEIPADVSLVAVAKGRQPAEVIEAVNEGALIIGENYVQEAEEAQKQVGRRVQWHFIGHLQSNKAKKAVGMFDMIQTVDSVQMAKEIDRRCVQAGRVLPVLIEVNSGREAQKSGLMPEAVEAAVSAMGALLNISIQGLMTMGPELPNARELTPYFRTTRRLFEMLGRADMTHVEMKHLSMGMSDSYKVAIAEGATMVRLGRAIFGER